MSTDLLPYCSYNLPLYLQCPQGTDALVVDVELLYLGEVTLGMCLVAQTSVAEGEHEEAVDAVLLVEVAIPNLKVGQRDGKVVHHLRLEEMLLAVADELVETAMSLGSATEFEEGQSLIENLLGLGIVVVHGCRRLGGSVGGQLPMLAGLHIVAQQLIGTAQEVVEIVVLCSLQLALAKVVGVEEALLEQAYGLLKQ